MRPGVLWLLISTGGALAYVVARKSGGLLGDLIMTGETAVGAMLPRGLRNNNPGNIRYIKNSPWKGQVGQDTGGYAVYDNIGNGFRALGKQLLAYERRGINTLRKIVSTWAPASDNNDEGSYVAHLAKALNVGADTPLNVGTRLSELAVAITRHENGIMPYAESDVRRWVYLP